MFPTFGSEDASVRSALFCAGGAGRPRSRFVAGNLNYNIRHATARRGVTFRSVIEGILNTRSRDASSGLLSVRRGLSRVTSSCTRARSSSSSPFVLSDRTVGGILDSYRISRRGVSHVRGSIGRTFNGGPPVTTGIVSSGTLTTGRVHIRGLTLRDRINSLALRLGRGGTRLRRGSSIVRRGGGRVRRHASRLLRGRRRVSGCATRVGACSIILRMGPRGTSRVRTRIVGKRGYLIVPVERGRGTAVGKIGADL